MKLRHCYGTLSLLKPPKLPPGLYLGLASSLLMGMTRSVLGI